MATYSETFTRYDKQGNVIGTQTITYTTSPEQDNEATLNDRAATALVDLRTLRDTTGTLSNAQVASGLRLLARVAIGLIRLQLRQLDSAD